MSGFATLDELEVAIAARGAVDQAAVIAALRAENSALEADNAALWGRVAALISFLRPMEWGGELGLQCQQCWAWMSDGHRPRCEFVEIINAQP